MLLLDCILYNQCGAVQNTLFFVFRESSPTVKDREEMDGSTFFVCLTIIVCRGVRQTTGCARHSIRAVNHVKKNLTDACIEHGAIIIVRLLYFKFP